MIVGLDTGCVSLVDIRPTTDGESTDATYARANLLSSSMEHDDVVSTLSLSTDGKRAVTGSLDRKYTHFFFPVSSY